MALCNRTHICLRL